MPQEYHAEGKKNTEINTLARAVLAQGRSSTERLSRASSFPPGSFFSQRALARRQGGEKRRPAINFIELRPDRA